MTTDRSRRFARAALTFLAYFISVAALAAAPPAARAAESPAATDTLSRIVPMPEIVVSTSRPGDRAPIARSTLKRDDLKDLNWGQDTPMTLATMPGAYAYSDAGNGVGYSYLTIRGFPQRRISVLVNGVPLNDPQSHEVYWIDHPDLLSSAAEVQMQRGVGSALYGAASVGGMVDVETSPFGDTPKTMASVSYGSWETKRLVLEMDSGALEGGWNLYGRTSRVESFGYREQSWSKLWSYALAARRRFGTQSVRVNLYGGPEETHLAYLGVPADYLDGRITGDRDRDRRYNPLTYPNERDHYYEPHYELIHSWAPRSNVSFTQTLFYFQGKGYYDEQRFGRSLADYRLSPWATYDSTLAPRDYYAQDTTGALVQDVNGRFTMERSDLVRRRTVVNRHYGWVPRARFEHVGGAITVGGEIRAHDGRHYGEVVSGSNLTPGTAPDYRYYDYHPRTLAGGLFVREEWEARTALLVTADLAWRHQSYFMRDDNFDGIQFDQKYDFALPRLGLTWMPRAEFQAYASWAQSRREPAFRDLYDAEGPGSVPLYRVHDMVNNVYEDPLVTPEHVNTYEAGASWSASAWSAALSLYRMDFRDELVYAGQFDTDLGYPIVGNAARSVHQGIELSARAVFPLARGAKAIVDGNATLGDNHFIEYRAYDGLIDTVQVKYDGNAIGFSPATLGNLSARLAWPVASIGADAQYAGRIYVDNTESEAASIAPRAVLNLSASLRPFPHGTRAELALRVLNALDRRYETGGYMDYDAGGNLAPQLIPAATRNWLAQVRVEF
jgi:iron complex outermembrane receptor protein